MTRQTLSEVLEAFKKPGITNAKKAEILHANAGKPLFYLLWLAFSDKVEWLVPEGTPHSSPGALLAEMDGRIVREAKTSDLNRELRRLYLFLKGGGELGPGGENLTRIRREKVFQQMLEGLPEEDVALLISIKDKKFNKDYNFSKKFLEETFPGLLTAPFKVRYMIQ